MSWLVMCFTFKGFQERTGWSEGRTNALFACTPPNIDSTRCAISTLSASSQFRSAFTRRWHAERILTSRHADWHAGRLVEKRNEMKETHQAGGKPGSSTSKTTCPVVVFLEAAFGVVVVPSNLAFSAVLSSSSSSS